MTLLLQPQQPKNRENKTTTELGTQGSQPVSTCVGMGQEALSAPADSNEQPHLEGPPPASGQDLYLSSEMELGLLFA